MVVVGRNCQVVIIPSSPAVALDGEQHVLSRRTEKDEMYQMMIL